MKKTKLKSRLQTQLESCDTLESCLDVFKITNWDYLLVGDGSGSNWDHAMGWASMLIEKASFKRQVYHGSANKGTVSVSEMMAYIHPLMHLASCKLKTTGTNIHILTDSQHVASCGMHRQSIKANAELWSMFEFFKRKGFRLTFHWIPRDVLALNVLADHLSRESRLSLTGSLGSAIDKYESDVEAIDSIYDINPAGG